jgi:hypothetical protein
MIRGKWKIQDIIGESLCFTKAFVGFGKGS